MNLQWPVALNTNAASDSGQDDLPKVTTDGVGGWVAVWQSSDSLGATIGIPAPLDSQTHSLDEFPPELGINLIEIHPDWMTEAQYEAYVHANYDLAFWMFSATSEIFDSIERYEPSMIVTNEARLMRRWLEY